MPDHITDPAKTLLLRAPLSGVLLPLAAVPDPVFADGMFGDGVALDPLSDPMHWVAPPTWSWSIPVPRGCG
ncbi:PTS glucose transporter subunit IIA [Cupriavidus necator]|uniref:PTS glucose transporter subunit IIA n=1 Tax=Cupriavidus necator TaxID=106590 RepID=UPI0039C08E3F